MSAERTIGSIWRDALAERRSYPAYLVETANGWDRVSWDDAGKRVDEIANGLLSLGIRKGDVVAILGRTRMEWALADFALALVGAVAAPLYADATAADWARAAGLVEPVAVFVDDGLSAPLEQALGDRAPRLLSLDSLDDLRARGREYRAEHPDALAAAEAAVGEDDLYTFIFTSGATGDPKACMIRHRNYHAMAATIRALEGVVVPGDTGLLYLPLAHNFGRLVVLEGAMAGITIAFLPDPLRSAEVLPEVRPTLFPGVPRLYEKLHERIAEQLETATGLRRRLTEWALEVGRRASPYKQRGRRLPPLLALQHPLADALVYSKVKKRLGGRLRTAFSGGAPLRKEIAELLHALDVLVLEGYGLSECTTACALNRPGQVRFGTVGRPLPGFEVRVAADGEIQIRSETVFAGYHRDEEATRAAFTHDGWLRSGDIGAFDEDGFLTITDRKKDIIVTAGGKNVAPQRIESALKAARPVSEALVVGNGRPYLVALLTLAAEAARDEVQQVVVEVNAGLARFEQIRRFTILPREFSAEQGEVTPTLKLRRTVCEEHFSAEIEALYRETA